MRPRVERSAIRRGVLWLVLFVCACQPGGPTPPGPAEPESREPVLAAGPISRGEQAEARRVFDSAETSFAARRYFEALRFAALVMERYPASDVSGAALLLTVRAEVAVDSAARADEAAERYLGLLPVDDPRAVEVRWLQVEAWEGDPARQLDRLLRLDSAPDTFDLGAAVTLARAAADSLSPEDLEAVLESAPTDGPLAPIPQVRHAVNLLDGGDAAAAADLARAALGGGAPEPERTVAEGVVRGELPPDRRRATAFEIATVLPEGGPPALADFAESVAEGVEVAAATVLGGDFQVTLTAFDDEGDPLVGAGLVAELESGGIAGVVGFLEDGALEAAGQARSVSLPMISPTARSAATAGEGVYSLEGPDPLAAASIGRYAASRAFQRVAIVLPESPPALAEADAFELEAMQFGVPVIGRFPYQPGETFFESQIIGARDALRAAEVAALGLGEEDTLRVEMLEPVALFLPIPPEDVEYVAAQVAHFALDTLAIELLGTSGWTDRQVLESVENRFTNGVVATAHVGTGPDAAGPAAFRAAYEQYFQRSLVSSTPAIGYDAALLLLEALRPGRVDPVEVRGAFQELRDVEGATGVFSVVDGRVIRLTEVVTIQDGTFTPVPPG